MELDRPLAPAKTIPSERGTPLDTGPGSANRSPVRVVDGDTVGVFAKGDGMRLWDDLLAPFTGLARSGRLASATPNALGKAGKWGRYRLESGFYRFGVSALPGGGEETGKNPTDRGKLGTKRHIIVDRNGIPLAVTVSGANVHDSKMMLPTIDAIEPIRTGRPGRPRQRPDKLHADKGYDYPHLRRALRQRGITPRIARRCIEPKDRLGRFRWVVERTLSWLNKFRRLKIRYERRVDIHEAFLQLGCALICLRFLV